MKFIRADWNFICIEKCTYDTLNHQLSNGMCHFVNDQIKNDSQCAQQSVGHKQVQNYIRFTLIITAFKTLRSS